jgi:acetylornithine deacetylase/succinyl-diaminopimelate desuccinylase-like protein
MALAQTFSPSKQIENLFESPAVHAALRFFDSNANRITEEQIRICSIPAPPFAETERAKYFSERFSALGLADVSIDEEGNCLALRNGTRSSPLLALSAHLDTVFPEGTDCTVKRRGSKLLAPGISDDVSGLVALLAMAEALQTCEIQTAGSLLFVVTVGEEGAGDLRGVRHVFTRGKFADRIDAFVSLDGAGIERITNSALGSRRYRVNLTGEGGHSWSDFGMANPVHALGRAIAKLSSYPAAKTPKTTFNVGRIEGGSSINAIPQQATMEVDLRSANEDELLKLDAFFRRAMREAIADENSLRTNGQPVQLNVELIGERPSGETRADSALVKLAWDATELVGSTPRLDQASTDSNLPISLGIPAITLGAGGTGGNVHTLDEWFDPNGREAGLKRALLVLLAVVGLRGEES